MAKSKEPQPPTIITKELWYKFSPDDLLNLGNEMAMAAEQVEALEKEKTAVVSELKERLQKAQGQIKANASKIRLGGEMRKIECREEKDFLTSTVRIFRNDNDELVEQRPMTTEERQQFLAFGEDMQGPRQIDLS